MVGHNGKFLQGAKFTLQNEHVFHGLILRFLTSIYEG